MEFFKDYDFEYQLGKANVVADVLSKKSVCFLADDSIKEANQWFSQH